MAIGDQAAAAGLTVFAATQDKRLGYQNDNVRGDDIGAHLLSGAAHAMAAITGLVAALAAKAASVHTHAAADVTSGTLLAARIPTLDAGSKLSGTVVLPVNTSGSVQAAGSVGSGFANAYDIGGSRKAAWFDSSGVIGYASSSRKKKQDIAIAELTEEQLRSVVVYMYRYRSEVTKERNQGGTDRVTGKTVALPGYRAATEIGVMAEDLHAAGLWMFVMYEGRGEKAVPIGVHYELLGLAAIRLAQIACDKYDSLVERIAKLEEK